MSMFLSSPYLLCVVRSAILLRSGSSFTLISRNPYDLIMRPHHLFDNNVPMSLDMLASIAAFAQSKIHGCVVGQASEETQIITPTMHPNLGNALSFSLWNHFLQVQIRTTWYLLSRSGASSDRSDAIRIRSAPIPLGLLQRG